MSGGPALSRADGAPGAAHPPSTLTFQVRGSIPMKMSSCLSAARILRRRRLLQVTAAALLGTSYASMAMAQTAAPTVDTVDENGVDLFSLKTMPQNGGEDISIGAGKFPARLSVSRATIPWTGMFESGSNLDITLGDGTSTTRIQSENFQVSLTIGGIRRIFRSDTTTGPQGMKFNPLDGGGGYLLKTLEGTTTVYTYYSSAGDTLRFPVTEAAACGRSPAFAAGTTYLTCARVSSWTAPNGVRADFTYNVRSEMFGYYGETDLASVTNTLGLSLAFTYTRYKDNGHNTAPAFAVTSIVASSNQLGACNQQASCSRTASYQYTPLTVSQVNIDIIDQTHITLNQFTDTLGNTTQYVRNGQLFSIRRAANPTVDAVKVVLPTTINGPVQIGDSFGNYWTYVRTVNSGNNYVTTTRTDPANRTRTYDFDAQGNLYRFQNELSQVTLQEYDGLGRVTKITLPSGVSTSRSYDGRGNVVSTATKATPAGSAPDITTSAVFEPDCTNPKTCNQPQSTTDARGHTTTYAYDPTHGGVLTVTRPPATTGAPAPQTRFTYGLVAGAYALTGASSCRTTASCTGTADETKVILGYGANGLQPTTTTTQSGDGTIQSTVSDTYDAFGNVTSEDGPLPGSADTVYMRYDRMGRVVGLVRPDPDGAGALARSASKTSYDANGNVIKVEAGVVNGVTDTDWAGFSQKLAVTTTYDADDRKIADVVSANGTTYGVTQYSYDALGNLDCDAVRMNSAAWGSLPASACALQTAGSVGPDRVTKYSYDYVGAQTKVTAGYGTTGPIDEVTKTYINGQLATAADANGNTTSYGYDGFGRLLTTTYPGGSYEQFGYDPNSNVTSRRQRDGSSVGYAYDDLDRVKTKTLPNGEPAATYTYDLAGHVLTTTQGTTLTYDWDALGRMKSETQPYGSLSFQYDPAGKRTRTTWQDGFYTTYVYDDAGQLTAIKENGSANLATFAYDDLGRRKTLTLGNGVTTTYTFDPISRPSGMNTDFAGTADDQNVTFTYNPAGQILTTTRSNTSYAFRDFANANRPYATNALNQYTSSGSTALGYDARGNLTSSDSLAYTYSSENLLKTGSGGIALYYDAAGRLIQYDSGTSTRMMYDGGQIAAEIANPSGTVTKRYIFGPTVDEVLVEYDASGNKTYLVGDERGSVIARTDGTGTVTVKNSYDEYGIPGANNLGRFQYTGQAWLNELGMSYYKARIYSPSLGRFMQTDPIGYGDGMNWYRYAGNDPINSSDPSGLSSCPDTWVCSDVPIVVYGSRPLPAGNWGPGYGTGLQFDFAGRDALAALGPHGQDSSQLKVFELLPNIPLPDSKYCTDARYKPQRDFVFSHRADAARLAKMLDTTTANVLGLAGLESGWGSGKIIQRGSNNFFGLTATKTNTGAFSAGSTGTMMQGGVRFETYPSFLAGGTAMAQSYIGARMRGVKDPASFVAAYNSMGKFNSEKIPPGEPSYNQRVNNTINTVSELLKCQ